MRLVSISGLVAAGMASTLQVSAEPRPVQLLIITLDTLRADHLGVYGYGKLTSPSIDAFALGATVFEDVTCSMPTTLPSHLTLFTGLTPDQHGITENGMIPRGNLVSLFDAPALRGARTAGIISARVLGKKFVAGLGFDEVLFADTKTTSAYQAPADAVTDQAISWLSANGNVPYALWLHYFDPHEAYEAPDRVAKRFVDETYDGPLSGPSREWLRTLNRKPVASRLTDRDRQHVIALYDAEIAFLDEQLGRLFEFLKTRDLWQDTLILIVGDHGEAHGENDYWGHGDFLLEPVIQVPFLVKLPGQSRGRRLRAPVETVDVVPTLVDYYGLQLEGEWSGRSLVGTLETGAEPRAKAYRLIATRTYSNTLRPKRRGLALHGGDWKLSVSDEGDGNTRYLLGRESGTGGLDGEDFYSPESPELRFLADLPVGGEGQENAPSPISQETLKMLRALGYVD